MLDADLGRKAGSGSLQLSASALPCFSSSQPLIGVRLLLSLQNCIKRCLLARPAARSGLALLRGCCRRSDGARLAPRSSVAPP